MKGTYLVSDLNQFDQAISSTNPSVYESGVEEVNRYFEERFEAHNRLSAEVVGLIATWTDKTSLGFGGYDKTRMTKTSEDGRAKPSKVGVGYQVGLPLEMYQHTWQMSWHYSKLASIGRLRKATTAMLDADVTNLMNVAMNALFRGTNFSFTEEFTDANAPYSYSSTVMALANADGRPLPPGPSGEPFDAATHTHYAAETGFTNGGVLAVLNNVREHFRDSRPVIWIAKAQETGMRGLTGFEAYPTIRVVGADNTDRILNPNLDPGNISDRAIGEFDGVPVWVKPQMPTGYILVVETNTTQKPVALRYDSRLGGIGLIPVMEDDSFPLFAKTFSRHVGGGCWNRVAAAVLKVNNADTTYVAPIFV
jgi:hypothetical protein